MTEMPNKVMLDYLFPRTRQKILSTLLSQPERRWYLSDLARQLGVGPSSLQREVSSLVAGGLLHREEEGNRVYLQVDLSFPLVPELRSIFAKTSGVKEAVASILQPFEHALDFAYIFGSFARGEQNSRSDIDLMLIGNVSMPSLSLPLRELQEMLGTEVNAVVYTLSEYRDKLNEGNHFLKTLQREPKVFLKGSDDDLANAVSR